jgi:transcriptional regulator of acetoin/glycerol metabolism
MVNEQDIEEALNALNTQLIPNFTQISEKFGIERTTLIRRFKGLCTSRVEATSLHYKLLTNT